MRLLAILILTTAHRPNISLRVEPSRDTNGPNSSGLLDISRFPHLEDFSENLKQRSGVIDVSLYMESLEDPRISEHLTDLPDELQQLQQQLLEVRREFRLKSLDI